MKERIRFISHRNKQVLLVDLSNCSAREVEQLVRALPDTVTAHPRSSVLILSDYTGATVDHDAFFALKESAVFDKPHVKKSAWVGVEGFPEVFRENLKRFSRRQFPIFQSREEALDWLVAD